MCELVDTIGSQLIGFILGVLAGIIASFATIYLLEGVRKVFSPRNYLSKLSVLT